MANWLITQTVDLASPSDIYAMYDAVKHLMVPGDEMAHTWQINVFKNGAAQSLSGYRAWAEFMRVDGVTVVVEGAVDANVATVVFSPECYAVPGALRAVVRISGGGSTATIAQRLFRVQAGTSDQIVDPGHIFDTAAAMEDRVLQLEMEIAAMKTAGSPVDYSEELAATIYEMERIQDWYGTHPWGYYLLDAEVGMLDTDDGTVDASGQRANILTSNYLRVPPSGEMKISWDTRVAASRIIMCAWSADRATYLGGGQCSLSSVTGTSVSTDDFTHGFDLEPGMWVRFSWSNGTEQYFTGFRIADAYEPDYESVDNAVTICTEAAAAVEDIEDAVEAVDARIDGITGPGTLNLLDATQLLADSGVTYANGVYQGNVTALSATQMTIEGGFAENTQYTFTAEAKRLAEGSHQTSLKLYIMHTDGTNKAASWYQDQTAFEGKSVTSTSGKTVSYVKFTYARSDATEWQVKNLMVAEGTSAQDYVDYAVSAVDLVARNASGLQPTGDTTDRSDEIEAMLALRGECKLGKGTFYVSGVTMPSGTTLCGCGDASKIVLASAETGAAVTMGDRCTVHDLTIQGATSDLPASDLDGAVIGTAGGAKTRRGIDWSGSSVQHGIVHGCRIERFACAGIYLADTGTPTDHGLLISDCVIRNNNVGIYLRKDAEFNKITNCAITFNYFGVLNRGGNNIIANCGIDRNIVGIRVDEYEGDNSGHGMVTGCTINHSGTFIGKAPEYPQGNGIEITGSGRMLFSNCFMGYSDVQIGPTTNGNALTGCEFGSYAIIRVNEGTGCSIINGCMFKSGEGAIVKTSGRTKVVNCYDRVSGEEVVANG